MWQARGVAVSDALPEFDVRSRHTVRVDAPPEVVLAAAKAVTAREAPLLRLLFTLRGLRAPGDRPVWEAMARDGFQRFDDDTLAAVGKPWTLRGGLRPAGGFREFAEPGWAKMAMDMRAEDGCLVTETRVRLTDEEARRRFRRYWRLVGPFSGLTRRSWLRAARRRAERGRRARLPVLDGVTPERYAPVGDRELPRARTSVGRFAAIHCSTSSARQTM